MTPEFEQSTAPPTRTDPTLDVLHGVEIPDSYRWLEDQNSPETRAWIQAQNEITDQLLGAVPGREKLSNRLSELMKVDAVGMPRACGSRYFFTRRSASQELFVLIMREGLHGKDQVILDPHPLSVDHTTSITLWDITRDGGLVAYGLREGGEDETTVRLLDVDHRYDLPDVLPRGRYFSVAVLPDRSGLYYVRYLNEGPRLYFHSMAAGSSNSSDTDIEIFGAGCGADKIIVADLSDDGAHLLITVMHGSAGVRTELYVLEAGGVGPVRTLVNDVEARFSGVIGGDNLFILTDWDASNGRVFRTPLEFPERSQWQEIVPASEDVIQAIVPAGGRIFVDSLHDVTTRIRIFQPDGMPIGEIPLPGPGSASFAGWWDRDDAFVEFTSFNVPSTIYSYSTLDGEMEVWASPNVPVDSSKFQVKQVWYESKDSTRIPMFLLYRKGIKLDGTNPALLTAYGGFGVCLTPTFSSRALIWAESGGVFAVPGLRGGGELGEAWHQAGMKENKQNVFDDFIAAAEWLVAKGYTQPQRLAISGGSNGGLLVGAALTQRPDLFGSVVCSYPLLDMIRYHRFLVAAFWISEYGSADNPDQFPYIYAYSPYHHVHPGTSYPAVLFITGDADTRVDPLHARKMTALLQQSTGSGKPVLLHYDTRAGHSGGRPLSKQIEDLTNEISFLFWTLAVE